MTSNVHSDTKSHSIVLKELRGSSKDGCRYTLDLKQRTQTKIQSNNLSYLSLKDFFKSVFLPEGFPQSVSEDYVSYQIWDTIQAFCSSISGALAAKAIFESVGVGDEKATAYGATLTWLIKDGTGMTGRIIFAWYQGSLLDSNSKMWRLYADILNDFSFFVDLLTPLFSKSYTIFLMSFSGLLKSIVGVAGGATRSALTQHQAKKNNLADVSAKDSSQETLVNLVALLFNIMLLSYIKDSKFLIWQLFIIFVLGHLIANYNAVKSVIMNTFNRNRFYLLTQHYFKTNDILTPFVCNKLEPVLCTVKSNFSIHLGCKLEHFGHLNEKKLNALKTHNYCLNIDTINKKIQVLLNENCNDLDLIKCLFQIEHIEFAFSQSENDSKLEFLRLIYAINENDSDAISNESFILMVNDIDKFIDLSMKQHWSYAYTQFSPGQFRYAIDKLND